MAKVTLTINGSSVTTESGKTILETARENGIDIPTLCYLEDVSPVGACRLCVVEVEGSRTLVGSCHTPVNEGMVVQTHSPKVLQARRIMIELILASHPENCILCKSANNCELRRIAADLGVGLPRFSLKKHYYPVEDENPQMIRDLSKCILCRRCVTACRSIKGETMFSIAYRGFNSKIAYGLDQTFGSEETCRDCDTCISVCPTGALSKPVRIGEPKQVTALFVKG